MNPVTFACNFLNNSLICNLLALLESSRSPLFKSLLSCPLLHTLYPGVELLLPSKFWLHGGDLQRPFSILWVRWSSGDTQRWCGNLINTIAQVFTISVIIQLIVCCGCKGALPPLNPQDIFCWKICEFWTQFFYMGSRHLFRLSVSTKQDWMPPLEVHPCVTSHLVKCSLPDILSMSLVQSLKKGQCVWFLTVYLHHNNGTSQGQFGGDILSPKLECLVDNLYDKSLEKIRCGIAFVKQKRATIFQTFQDQKTVKLKIVWDCIISFDCGHYILFMNSWIFSMQFRSSLCIISAFLWTQVEICTNTLLAVIVYLN